MKINYKITDYPDFQKVLDYLIENLFNESRRGAIIICATFIEDELKKYIIEIIPNEMGKKYQNKLLKYPGLLSSFASKIEISYVFGLINRNIYDLLNNFKRLRNEAAHSPSDFTKEYLESQLNIIFSTIPGMMDFISKEGINLMFLHKKDSLNLIFDENNLTDEERKQIYENVFKDEKTMNALNQQVFHWVLMVGACIVCSILFYHCSKRIKELKIERNEDVNSKF